MKAAARGGPQGVETRRLAGVQPPLDESFAVIKSRDKQPPAARRAMLLNRRLGEDAAAAEEAAAAQRAADLDWPTGGGLDAMEVEGAGAAAWAADAQPHPEPPEVEWEQEEEAREEAVARGEPPEMDAAAEAETLEELLRSLRNRLGVRRMPRLSESEGYAVAHRGWHVVKLVTLSPSPSSRPGTGCTTRGRSPTSQSRPACFRSAPWCGSGRVATAPCP